MACKICGRGACATWMHSIEDQEAHERKLSDPTERIDPEDNGIGGSEDIDPTETADPTVPGFD